MKTLGIIVGIILALNAAILLGAWAAYSRDNKREKQAQAAGQTSEQTNAN